MSPIKLKLRKRKGGKYDEYEATIPPKKKNLNRVEKENKIFVEKEIKKEIKKASNILENSPTLNFRANIKTYENNKLFSSESNDDENNKLFSSESDDDDDFMEMFLQLKKNGINTNFNSLKVFKNSEELKKKRESSSLTKNLGAEKKTPENVKKNIIEKCETDSSTKKRKTSKSNSIIKVPELEKLPEDLIINCKKTPTKAKKLEFEETPDKNKSFQVTPRRSNRLSGITKESFIHSNEKTPDKRISKTPKKFSSTKEKIGSSEPTTPISKIEEKLPSTPLEKARLSLQVSTVPDILPCREKEYNNIYKFLENKLWDKIGGCMYISGVPGTGKTATVKQVIYQLQICSEEKTVPDFKFVEINGMKLSDPRQAYVQIWQKLFNKKEKIPSDMAYMYLNKWFNKEDKKNEKKSTVLLVDELDLICTKKQDVVYNLLDWPTQPHSRLIVLTIANTMDMPERLFKGRVTSRMGLTRLTFMPYSYKQLEEIVMARLKGLDAFVTDAVRLVSRKVAAVSGDARRALDICRRATELPSPNDTVKISHVEKAIKEMTNSNTVKIIRNCCQLEKLFLRSLSDLSFRSNVEEVNLLEVIDQLLTICVLEGISRPTVSSILNVSNRLRCCRLIFTHQSTLGILQKVMLNVTQDDIHYALQNV